MNQVAVRISPAVQNEGELRMRYVCRSLCRGCTTDYRTSFHNKYPNGWPNHGGWYTCVECGCNNRCQPHPMAAYKHCNYFESHVETVVQWRNARDAEIAELKKQLASTQGQLKEANQMCEALQELKGDLALYNALKRERIQMTRAKGACSCNAFLFVAGAER